MVGTFERRYNNRIKKVLEDKAVCKENRKFWKLFFEKEEYKLKRRNNLRKLDEGCYKTLYFYIRVFMNINRWFDNKPWKDITKEDYKKFYDDFEDGKILTQNGKPCEDRKKYYNAVFKSKPFEMLGKKEMVKEVMEFHQTKKPQDVRFITEEDFRKLMSVIIKPVHRLLTWLAFDIGENVGALLELRKSDCVRQLDDNTNTSEYRINLREETLKRSRKSRSEITNYKETIELLDMILGNLEDDEKIFNFEYRNAKKFMDRAVDITGLKCQPKGQNVTWKDLRSSMACDLLNKDWSCDEVNARLGHVPSSSEINKYVNFLALDRRKPKRKIHQHQLSKVQLELEKAKEREKLQARRMETMKNQLDALEKRGNINQIMDEYMKRSDQGQDMRSFIREQIQTLMKEEVKSQVMQI